VSDERLRYLQVHSIDYDDLLQCSDINPHVYGADGKREKDETDELDCSEGRVVVPKDFYAMALYIRASLRKRAPPYQEQGYNKQVSFFASQTGNNIHISKGLTESVDCVAVMLVLPWHPSSAISCHIALRYLIGITPLMENRCLVRLETVPGGQMAVKRAAGGGPGESVRA
jgi:hypothetical protein